MFASISANDLLMPGMYSLVVVVPLYAIQYLALRIRDTRANLPDPHLGRKAVCYMFFNAGVLFVLVGLTISALDWTSYIFEDAVKAQQARQSGGTPPAAAAAATPRDWFNQSQRAAAGLILSGLVYAALFRTVAWLFTNDREYPAVRRAFAGQRFVIAGLIVMYFSTFTMISLFQRGETNLHEAQVVIGFAVVWGPAAAIHLALLLWSSGWQRNAASK